VNDLIRRLVVTRYVSRSAPSLTCHSRYSYLHITVGIGVVVGVVVEFEAVVVSGAAVVVVSRATVVVSGAAVVVVVVVLVVVVFCSCFPINNGGTVIARWTGRGREGEREPCPESMCRQPDKPPVRVEHLPSNTRL